MVVYGAVAAALLLVGAGAIRGGGSAEPEAAVAAGGGAVEVHRPGGDVVVHVTGTVARPGVYRLPLGSRVEEAVDRAGGAVAAAELDAVNLAARLADGQQVVVPERGAPPAVAGGGEEGPIGLGTATVEQLETIDGIGPVTAAAIVEFRDRHGGLASVEQLDQVSGIGPATMESLRERLQP